LPESTSLYESLWHSAPCGHVVTDPTGVIVEVNSTLLAWMGYERSALVGARFADLLDPGSRFFYETRQAAVLQLQGEVREVSLSLRRPDGSAFPALLNAVLADDGSVQFSVFDATERHGYERELLLARRAAEATELRLQVLQDATGAFGGATSFAALGDAVVESVRLASDAAAVAVMMPGPDGVLRVIAGAHPVGTVIEPTLPSARAFTESRVIAISNLDEARAFHPVLATSMRELHFEAMLAVPLLDTFRAGAAHPEDAAPIGTVSSFFGRGRVFDDDAIALQQALMRQAAQAFESIRLIAELEQLALRDALTGLANRSLFNEILERGLSAAVRESSSLAVIFIDLDGFKAVNDTLGHASGDALLVEIAQRLSAVVRLNDVIARLGGDEFVVFCEHADEEAAMAVAERIRVAIGETVVGIPLPVSASVGVAIHRHQPDRAITHDDLLIAADDAMYLAKAAGKNRVELTHV